MDDFSNRRDYNSGDSKEKTEDDIDLESLICQHHELSLSSSTENLSNSFENASLYSHHQKNEQSKFKTNSISSPISIICRRFKNEFHVSSSAPKPTINKGYESDIPLVHYTVHFDDTSKYYDVKLPTSSICAKLIDRVFLARKQTCEDLLTWCLFEQDTNNMTERIVEDNEIVERLVVGKSHENINRLSLKKNFNKYSLLKNPELTLPPKMLVMPKNYNLEQNGGNMSKSVKRINYQHILAKTSSKFCGHLYVNNLASSISSSKWKKLFCVLQDSGIYYSTKNNSLEVQHLKLICSIESSEIWSSFSNSKNCNKQLKSPTTQKFCIKPRKYIEDLSEVWFCCENEKVKNAWISCLRMKSFGKDYFLNCYNLAKEKDTKSVLTRSISEKSIYRFERQSDNFACMDFSGSRGRVVKDPLELENFKMEQKLNWSKGRRQTDSKKIERNNLCPASLPRSFDGKMNGNLRKSSAWIDRVLHHGQKWFHGKLTREEANNKLGCVDGTYLVRDSKSTGCNVLSLVYNQKPRHYPIVMTETPCGDLYCTIDDGRTKFENVLSLVNFYKINRGVLPCPLVNAYNKI